MAAGTESGAAIVSHRDGAGTAVGTGGDGSVVAAERCAGAVTARRFLSIAPM